MRHKLRYDTVGVDYIAIKCRFVFIYKLMYAVIQNIFLKYAHQDCIYLIEKKSKKRTIVK